MSLLRRALDAASRAAWEADRHLTPWDDLPESVRDTMRNLVRTPVVAALAVAAPKVAPDDVDTDAACGWSDFRKEYGVSSDDAIRRREHRAYLAGFEEGRHGDRSSPLT